MRNTVRSRLESLIVAGADNEPGVRALRAIFQTRHHPAWLVPASGFVAEAESTGELMAMGLVVGPDLIHGRGSQCLQSLVAGHAHDVIHLIAITPGQQSGLAEVGVAPEHDPGLWPIPANKSHQQRQNGPAVPGITSIAGAQIAHQQVPYRRRRKAGSSSDGRNTG